MNLIQIFKIVTLLAVTEGASTICEKDARIVGGRIIDISEAPYTVALSIIDDPNIGTERFQCGGSIIAEDLILTAAHCIYTSGEPVNKYRVRAGSTKNFNTDEGQYMKVKKIIVHEELPNLDMDVALLRLENPLEFNAKVQKMELATADATVNGGDLCNVTGWGLTRTTNEPELSPELRLVTIPVVDKTLCREWYSNASWQLTDNMLCAGTEEGGKGACGGDSGGPLVCNGVQFGIVTRGPRMCNEKKRPVVYAYVPKLRKWIDEHIELV